MTGVTLSLGHRTAAQSELVAGGKIIWQHKFWITNGPDADVSVIYKFWITNGLDVDALVIYAKTDPSMTPIVENVYCSRLFSIHHKDWMAKNQEAANVTDALFHVTVSSLRAEWNTCIAGSPVMYYLEEYHWYWYMLGTYFISDSLLHYMFNQQQCEWNVTEKTRLIVCLNYCIVRIQCEKRNHYIQVSREHTDSSQ